MTDKRVVPVEFVKKLKREMPANTVIGDPEWWAERLYKWAIAAAPAPSPVEPDGGETAMDSKNTSVFVTNTSELSVSPLTAKEIRWIKSLQRVLSKCPDRLELVVSGDPAVSIVDADGAKESDLCDGAMDDDGIRLAWLPGKPTIHGVRA